MPSTERIPVSVLILTLNEAGNIGRCIDSLAWTDDVVVLDSFSSDDTREIARHLGARVYERRFDDFAGQRNYALDTIEFKYDWILHLDADETVTPDLKNELAAVLPEPEFRAYRIPSKLMLQGRWLRRSGMYPSYQVRFGHVESLRFKQVGHGQRESLSAEHVGTFQSPYLHDGFSKGLSDWIERHNRYSTDEALLALEFESRNSIGWFRILSIRNPTERRRALKAKAAHLPFRPLLRFLYMYVVRMGFLDGSAGFTYSRLLAMYEYWTVLKIREYRKLQDGR